ncbi:MAG TPA: peroxide stress protein YaaA [Jiangellales bacterium]|nr:peroxide stress protein YaaA [Jiangellales bacterium]
MLVLLPPSEGKTAPRRGRPLDLDTFAFPELAVTRRTVLDALVELCHTDREGAARVLALGRTQQDDVAVNADLAHRPAAPAGRVYTGVLYEALGLADLPSAATRRSGSWLAIASGLWGLVRPADRIPAYRLPGGVSLPGVGPLAAAWRGPLAAAVPAAAGRGLVLDLRSTTYAAMWHPTGPTAERTVTVRVLRDRDGERSVVSHDNKATKGRLVRALLLDGSRPRTPAELREHLVGLGFAAESVPRARPGRPYGIDVVLRD